MEEIQSLLNHQSCEPQGSQSDISIESLENFGAKRIRSLSNRQDIELTMEFCATIGENISIPDQMDTSLMEKTLASDQLDFSSAEEVLGKSLASTSAYHELETSSRKKSVESTLGKTSALNKQDTSLTKEAFEKARSLIMPNSVEASLNKKPSRKTGERRKKNSLKPESFQRAITNIRKQKHPKMQLSSDSKKIMDEIVTDFIDMYKREFKVMEKIKKHKTLLGKQVERATMLCLPKKLGSKAIEEGRRAVLRSMEYSTKTVRNISTSDQMDIAPNKESVQRIFENEWASDQLDTLPFKNHVENTGLNASVLDQPDTSSAKGYFAATRPHVSMSDSLDFSSIKMLFENPRAERIKRSVLEDADSEQDSKKTNAMRMKTSVSVNLDASLGEKSSLKIGKRPPNKTVELGSFQRAVHKIFKKNHPGMQISADTKIILDEIISKFIEMYDKELKAMKRVKIYKTLLVEQIERATALCLPKRLRDKAMEKGQGAILRLSE